MNNERTNDSAEIKSSSNLYIHGTRAGSERESPVCVSAELFDGICNHVCDRLAIAATIMLQSLERVSTNSIKCEGATISLDLA